MSIAQIQELKGVNVNVNQVLQMHVLDLTHRGTMDRETMTFYCFKLMSVMYIYTLKTEQIQDVYVPKK